MRLIILIVIFSLNGFTKEVREPAQYIEQIDIVTEKIKSKNKRQKVQHLKEFFDWMQTKNSEEIPLLLSDNVSEDIKSKIKQNRIIYYGLEPLKEAYIDKGTLPNQSQCKDLIKNVKYDDLIGRDEASPQLNQSALKIIKLLTNTCL